MNFAFREAYLKIPLRSLDAPRSSLSTRTTQNLYYSDKENLKRKKQGLKKKITERKKNTIHYFYAYPEYFTAT